MTLRHDMNGWQSKRIHEYSSFDADLSGVRRDVGFVLRVVLESSPSLVNSVLPLILKTGLASLGQEFVPVRFSRRRNKVDRNPRQFGSGTDNFNGK